MVANTVIRVFDMRINKEYKFKVNYVSNVCISNDDRFLFYSRECSGYIKIYDLIEHKLVKRCITRSKYIKSIHQYSQNQLLIWGKSEWGKSFYELYIYNFIDDKVEIYKDDNIISVEEVIKYNNKLYYPIDFIDGDNEISKYCEFYNDELIKHHDKLNNDKNVLFSNDNKYCAVINKIFLSDEKDYQLLNENTNIDMYNCDDKKLIFKIKDREFKSTFDILMNQYYGHFVTDLNNENIFYTFPDNKIIFYYLESKVVKEINLDKEIMDCFVSFKNDYVAVRVPETWQCN